VTINTEIAPRAPSWWLCLFSIISLLSGLALICWRDEIAHGGGVTMAALWVDGFFFLCVGAFGLMVWTVLWTDVHYNYDAKTMVWCGVIAAPLWIFSTLGDEFLFHHSYPPLMKGLMNFICWGSALLLLWGLWHGFVSDCAHHSPKRNRS
jgi:hypothetical protein